MSRPKQPALRPLLQPASVAVIGATERPDASSSFVMRNLITHGYKGAIYPVHPRAEQVYGYPAVPKLSQLETAPELAIICIAARHVAGALAEAGARGVPAAIVLSSGFAESGPEGAARQVELTAIANQYGMALCGPNCLGIVGMHEDAVLYSSRFPHGLPKGRFALISQSGASAIALSGTGRIGLSYIISAGNSAVTGAADYLTFLANDANTDVIGLVLENIRQPEMLANATAQARAAGKQVLALYFGRSAQGAAATAAHTGALGGSYKAFQAFCRQQGIIAVDSMDELLESAALFSAVRQPPRPTGVALVGVSGGGVAHVADFAAEAGLALPALAPETVAGLDAILPGYVTPQNPLDVTGLPFADGSVYTRVLALLAADPAIGLIGALQDVPAGLDPGGAAEYLPIAQGLADFAAAHPTPVVVLSNLAAGHHPNFRDALVAAGLPWLNGTQNSLRALRRLVDPPSNRPLTPPDSLSADPAWQARLSSGAPLTEREAKGLLAAHDIPVPREELAHSATEAVSLAEQIGYPVALKIEAPQISHKSDVGGVLLNLANGGAVAAGYAQIMAAVSAAQPEATLNGVLVGPMISGGTEAFVSLSQQAPFGFGLMVGVGGLYVELLGEPELALLPLDRPAIAEALERSPLGKLLAGYRGGPAGDRAAFIETIYQLCRLAGAYAGQIDTIELNPIAVLPAGQGVAILDALILTAAQP